MRPISRLNDTLAASRIMWLVMGLITGFGLSLIIWSASCPN